MKFTTETARERPESPYRWTFITESLLRDKDLFGLKLASKDN